MRGRRGRRGEALPRRRDGIPRADAADSRPRHDAGRPAPAAGGHARRAAPKSFWCPDAARLLAPVDDYFTGAPGARRTRGTPDVDTGAARPLPPLNTCASRGPAHRGPGAPPRARPVARLCTRLVAARGADPAGVLPEAGPADRRGVGACADHRDGLGARWISRAAPRQGRGPLSRGGSSCAFESRTSAGAPPLFRSPVRSEPGWGGMEATVPMHLDAMATPPVRPLSGVLCSGRTPRRRPGTRPRGAPARPPGRLAHLTVTRGDSLSQ
ncbi:hypothetical protein ACRAWF_23455 [Streptomyces sp. L7]